MKIALAILAVTVAMPAYAADQFDLICKGTIQTMNPGLLIDKTEPWSLELRIDLKEKRYCSDECKGTLPIFRFDEQNIELSEGHSNDPLLGTSDFYVRRVNGEMAMYHFPKERGESSFDGKATCEAAPFKGFPKPPTKF